jgi:hypothetical protein
MNVNVVDVEKGRVLDKQALNSLLQ